MGNEMTHFDRELGQALPGETDTVKRLQAIADRYRIPDTSPLADKLNQLGVVPVTDSGKVGLLIDGNPLTDEQLESLELEPDEDGYFGSVDEHPEGADRGGYVPTLSGGPHWYDEWVD